MAYDSGEARRELLDVIGDATDRLALALAAIGAAYEQLDDATADRLEEALFRPVQLAYGRSRRTFNAFASRYGLPLRDFEPALPGGVASQGVKVFVERAVDAVADADDILSELQDSMRPVEVGDPELRAGLAEVRELLGAIRAQAREFVRVLGR
jgi:hypothetical protein